MIFARTREKSLNRHHMNQRRIKNGWVADIFIKVLFEPGLCNNYQEKEVVKRKGRCPLLILHSHQLNMFN